MCNDHSGYGWEWGAITDSTTWTDNDARVVCRQLGLATSGIPLQVPGAIIRTQHTNCGSWTRELRRERIWKFYFAKRERVNGVPVPQDREIQTAIGYAFV